LIRGLKGVGAKVKAKVAAGKAWAKGKVEAVNEWAKGRLAPTAVKAQAREMLGGRHFKNAGEARAAINATWTKLQPRGLKGLRLEPGSKGKPPAVLVSASLAERIALSTSATEVLGIALKMRMLTGTTTAYVTYGGDTRFGPAGGFSNRGGHAERHIEQQAPALLARIERERQQGKFKVDQSVPIVIDMNRLPCDHCVPRMEAAFASAKSAGLVSVTLNAASVWKQQTGGIELTSDKSLARLRKTMDVQPFHVWPLIERKLRSFGQPEVHVGGRVYAVEEWLNLNAGSNGVGAYDVEEKLARLNADSAVLPPISVGTSTA
jgi:hypothetical protein